MSGYRQCECPYHDDGDCFIEGVFSTAIFVQQTSGAARFTQCLSCCAREGQEDCTPPLLESPAKRGWVKPRTFLPRWKRTLNREIHQPFVRPQHAAVIDIPAPGFDYGGRGDLTPLLSSRDRESAPDGSQKSVDARLTHFRHADGSRSIGTEVAGCGASREQFWTPFSV